MKICIFTETYYPVMGGGETQAQLLAEGLITNGHSVIVLTRRSDALLKKREQYGKVDVACCFRACQRSSNCAINTI
jgi:NADP-dependent 3-hydroxy acid dehydrogenase YdfG